MTEDQCNMYENIRSKKISFLASFTLLGVASVVGDKLKTFRTSK